MFFMYLFSAGRGSTNACICMRTMSQLILQMDVPHVLRIKGFANIHKKNVFTPEGNDNKLNATLTII